VEPAPGATAGGPHTPGEHNEDPFAASQPYQATTLLGSVGQLGVKASLTFRLEVRVLVMVCLPGVGVGGRGRFNPPADTREVPRPERLAVNPSRPRQPGPPEVRSTFPAHPRCEGLIGRPGVVPKGESGSLVIGLARQPH
jgi:hypothetical protein